MLEGVVSRNNLAKKKPYEENLKKKTLWGMDEFQATSIVSFSHIVFPFQKEISTIFVVMKCFELEQVQDFIV